MKRAFTIVLLCICAFSTANAATYYVKSGGNNASAGTSWDLAWAHPNKTNTGMSAGDTCFFAPGEYDSVLIQLKQGSGSQRTVYSCSGGVAGRGLVIWHGGLPVANSWTNSSGQIYYTTSTVGTSGTRWVNTPEVYNQNVCAYQRISGTVDSLLIPMSATPTAAGQMYYDRANTRLYVWCYGGGSPTTKIRASTKPVVLANNEAQDKNIFVGIGMRGGYQGVVILGHGGSDMSAAGGGCDSNMFIACDIGIGIETQSNNPAGIYNGQSYGATKSTWSQYVEVRSCSITQIRAINGGGGLHAGFGLELYSCDRWTIDSNVITACGGGIGLKMGLYDDSGLDAESILIRYNIIDCNKITTEGESATGIWVGNKNRWTEIAGNVIYNTNIAINMLTSDDADPMEGGFRFWNNTLVNAAESFVQFAPHNIVGGNWFKYNIIVDTVSAPGYGYMVFRSTSDGTGLTETPSTERYWSDTTSGVIDSNMYYDGDETFTCLFMSTSGYTGTNWSSWQSHFDAHSTSTTDPRLNATTYAPSNATAMNVTHSGRTWTQYGAIQEEVACADTLVAPVFESPADGATGQQNSVILDWSDSTQVGSPTVYDLQVDNNSDFSSVTFSSSPTDSRDTVLVALQYSTTYYWRVRGRSACDTSAWSGSRSFTMRAWPLYQDTCLQITEKVNLNMGDTCYCIVDSLLYTFAQRDTLIHTQGYDNIRIWGAHGGGGRGIIRYDASDTGSLAWDTDTSYSGHIIHVVSSQNVKIANLAIIADTVPDTVRQLIPFNLLSSRDVEITNCSTLVKGMAARTIKSVSTGGSASYNLWVHDNYSATESKGYNRRDQLYGATYHFGGGSKAVSGYSYLVRCSNNRIGTVHTGVAINGAFTYPIFYVDSNTITVDTRNDFYTTFDDNDVNNSTGDPFCINIDEADSLSHIIGNTLLSGTAQYGGDGMMLQHINATATNRFEVYNNTMILGHGMHPRIAEGRQAVIGVYARNDAAATTKFVSGLHLYNNLGYLIVDEDTSTHYAGRYGECVRVGFENGANGNLIENNHFTLIPRDSLSRTGAGALEVSGLTFEQHDSTNSAGDAGTGNNIARYNYWRVPRNPIWLGGTRIGIGADNVQIIGDTCNTLYDGDSTFARFHQSGTYYSHSINNTFQDMVLQGYANTADVIKGTVTASPDQFGKQLAYLRGLTVNLKDVASANVNGGTIWATNAYGERFDLPNTNGSGNSYDTLRWRFFGYDALPADGYVVADSNSYNNFTFWGKSGFDSASVTTAVNWTTSPNINIQLTTSTPPTPQSYNSFRGTALQGVIIK